MFDVDAWLLDMGVGSELQPQAPSATPAQNANGNQYDHCAAQRGSASLSRPHSSGSDSSRVRYRPPHRRIDSESSSEMVLSSPQPSAHSNGIAYTNGTPRKPPPGFPALYQSAG